MKMNHKRYLLDEMFRLYVIQMEEIRDRPYTETVHYEFFGKEMEETQRLYQELREYLTEDGK